MELTDQDRIERSIEHWEKLRDDPLTSEKPTSMWCALCDEYFHQRCRDCPIEERTGEDRCDNTPYSDAYIAWEDWKNCLKDEEEDLRQEFEVHAQKELDFLTSLLQPEEPDDGQ